MTRRDEWATLFFGTWVVGGLFLDGWAHAVNKPESFFSPWHGVLYSGFAAGMTFAAITTLAARRRGEKVEMDRFMIIGVGLFVAGGVGDMVWHEVFGIEVGIDALLSPTHLLLMGGGLLLLTTPIRARWGVAEEAPPLRTLLPAIGGLTLSVGLLSFFTMYLSAFGVQDLDASSDMAISYAVASVLVTNVLLVGGMLVALRRWTTPPGAFTIMFTAVAIGMAGLEGFRLWPLAMPAVAAGMLADLLVARSAPVRLLSAAVPATLWATWFAVMAATSGMGWPPELWGGTLVLAVLSGVGLSYVAFPPPPSAFAPSDDARTVPAPASRPNSLVRQ